MTCDWKDDIITPATEDGEESEFDCDENEYLAGLRSTYNKDAYDRM